MNKAENLLNLINEASDTQVNALEAKLAKAGIDFSRLDMSADDVDDQLRDCIKDKMSFKQCLKLFRELSGDERPDRFGSGAHG